MPVFLSHVLPVGYICEAVLCLELVFRTGTSTLSVKLIITGRAVSKHNTTTTTPAHFRVIAIAMIGHLRSTPTFTSHPTCLFCPMFNTPHPHPPVISPLLSGKSTTLHSMTFLPITLGEKGGEGGEGEWRKGKQ